MPLPNLPPATAQEELADQAKALGNELANVAKQVAQLEHVSAAEAKTLTDEIVKVATKADAVGPILEKLFALDPKGARALEAQFQAVIDKAAEMAGKVRDKAEETERAAQKAATTGKGNAVLGDLQSQLAGAGEAMKDMESADAPALIAKLDEIAAAAERAGPEMEKLLKGDPAAAKAYQDRLKAVADQAGKMGREVAKKAPELKEREAKESLASRKEAMAPIVSGANKAGAAASGNLSFTSVGEMFGPEGAAVGAVADAVKAAIDAVATFAMASVQAFNPGVMERYQRSVQDLGAVFGQAFTPLVEMATEFTDKINGVLTSIAPIIGDMVNAFVSDLEPVINQVIELFQTMAHSFQDAARVLGPVLKVLFDFASAQFQVFLSVLDAIQEALQALAEAFFDAIGAGDGFKDFMAKVSEQIKIVAQVAKDLIYTLAEMVKQFAKTGTVDVGKAFKDAKAKEAAKDTAAKEAGNNKTFAARPAEFAGIEDIGKQAQLKAASLGVGAAAKTPDENTADIADKVADMETGLADLADRFKTLCDGVAVVAKWADAALKVAGQAGEVASKGLGLEERGLAAFSSGGVSEIMRALFGGG